VDYHQNKIFLSLEILLSKKMEYDRLAKTLRAGKVMKILRLADVNMFFAQVSTCRNLNFRFIRQIYNKACLIFNFWISFKTN
jgi:hypothetical protein